METSAFYRCGSERLSNFSNVHSQYRIGPDLNTGLCQDKALDLNHAHTWAPLWYLVLCPPPVLLITFISYSKFRAPTLCQALAWTGNSGPRSGPCLGVSIPLHINTCLFAYLPRAALCQALAGHRAEGNKELILPAWCSHTCPPSPFAYSWHSVVEIAQALEPDSPGSESWLSYSQAMRSWSSSFNPLGLSFFLWKMG